MATTPLKKMGNCGKGCCPDLKKALKGLDCLKGMDIEVLCPFFSMKNLPAGEVLFREGDEAAFMAFILSGKLEIKKQTEFPAKYFVLSILGKDSCVGEQAISWDKTAFRSATATALEETEMVLLTRASFDDIYNKYPNVAARLLKSLLHEISFRLNAANERMAAVF